MATDASSSTARARAAAQATLMRAVYFEELAASARPTTPTTGTIRTNAAAAILGVSPNTLRAWERRFGFPEPRRTPDGYRQFDLAEIEALRAAFEETQKISSAVSAARSAATTGARPLAQPLSLRDVSRALEGLDLLYSAAGAFVPTTHRGHLRSVPAEMGHYRIRSLSMASPLSVVVEIPVEAWTVIGVGLVALAKRVVLFPSKTGESRALARRNKEYYDAQREAIARERAAGAAAALNPQFPRPERITFYTEEDDPTKLELSPEHHQGERGSDTA